MRLITKDKEHVEFFKVYVEAALSSIKFLSQQKITHRVPKSEKPYMSIKNFDKICSVFGGTLIKG
jgi:hypothetical protein